MYLNHIHMNARNIVRICLLHQSTLGRNDAYELLGELKKIMVPFEKQIAAQ